MKPELDDRPIWCNCGGIYRAIHYQRAGPHRSQRRQPNPRCSENLLVSRHSNPQPSGASCARLRKPVARLNHSHDRTLANPGRIVVDGARGRAAVGRSRRDHYPRLGTRRGRRSLPDHVLASSRTVVPIASHGKPLWNLDWASSVARHLERNRSTISRLDALPFGQSLHRIDPADVLCSDGYCLAARNQKALYFDDNHLSVDGARLVIDLLPRPLVQHP